MSHYKFFLRTAAVGLSIVLVWRLIMQIDSFRFWLHRDYHLFYEFVTRGFHALDLVCMALVCFTLFACRKQLPNPDNRLRIMTHLAAWPAFLVTLSHILDPYLFHGIHFFYVDPVVFNCILLLSIIWIWMMSNRQGTDHVRNSLSTATMLAGVFCCLELLLMVIAALYVLINGHLWGHGLYTSYYFSWIRICIPAILLPAYALHLPLWPSISPEKKEKIKDIFLSILVWILFFGSIIVVAIKFIIVNS